MENTNILRKMDKLGRIAIPHELRQILKFNKREKIEIFVENESIVLKKHQPFSACLMTGEILPINKEYAPGIFLSPEGAEILLKHLTKSPLSQTPQH